MERIIDLAAIDDEGWADHPDEVTDNEHQEGLVEYLEVDDLDDESGGDPDNGSDQ